MSGAITNADREFIEQWESITAPTYTVMQFDYQGKLQQKLIPGQRVFTLSTAERKITEELIVRVEDNPFRNGAFRPIVAPDSITIESNPNAMSDDEIRSVLVASDLAWEEWMKVIDSPDTLTRMLDIAGSVPGVTLSRFKAIEARLQDVRPKTRVTNRDRERFEAMQA